MPGLGEAGHRAYQEADRIAADPAYGRVVCFCERVTAGEIRDAFDSTIPPVDLDGLRRRTARSTAAARASTAAPVSAPCWPLPGPSPRPPRSYRDRRTLGRPPGRAGAGRGRRRRAVRADRGSGARRAARRRGAGHRAEDAPAASRGTATTSGTASATCTGSSPVRRTPAGSPSRRGTPGRGSRRRPRSPDGTSTRRLLVTSPGGRRVVEADAVVLATGARERPRSARRIPGDRPDGVYTTGELQNLVHLHHVEVGSRAVVVGAELVSWSAVLTLRRAGCRTVAMTTAFDHAEAYARVPPRRPGRAPDSRAAPDARGPHQRPRPRRVRPGRVPATPAYDGSSRATRW